MYKPDFMLKVLDLQQKVEALETEGRFGKPDRFAGINETLVGFSLIFSDTLRELLEQNVEVA